MQAIKITDIIDALRGCGIRPGDTVFVHSFLGAFGRLEGGVDAVLAAFREAITPNGTLILPTYNYDFCAGTPYDHAATPSQVGQLTETFRARAGVARSFHPVYSHAVEGPKKDFYTREPSPSAFGAESFFARLRQDDARIVFFGVSLQYATYLHYVEEQVGVRYRFMKNFKGTVRDGGQSSEFTAPILSRYRNIGLEYDMLPFQARLLERGLAHRATLGRGEVVMVTARDFFDEGTRFLKDNEFGFLRSPIDRQTLESARED